MRWQRSMSVLPSLLVLLGPLQGPLPDETVVTAPRSTETATTSSANRIVISGEELRETGARSLPQAISRAGGVWVQETNLGGGAPFIRGLVGNQVLILVDGVRINDSTTRSGPNQSLNTIDPAIVDRVEVLRGPSSVLYGSDAIGGVVSIWTKRRAPAVPDSGAPAGLDGGVDLTYRSVVDGGRASGLLSYAGERDGWIWIGSAFDFDDLETGDGTAEFTGYDGFGGFGAWTHSFDEHRSLDVSARFHRDNDVPRTDRLVVGFGQTQPSREEFTFERQQREGYLVSWTDREPGAIADEVQVRLSYRRYVEERREQGFGATTATDERDEVHTIGLGVDLRKPLGEDHLLTYGFDVDTDDVDSSKEVDDLVSGTSTAADGDFAPDARFTSLGVFVQDEIFAFDPFDVTAGVRFSYHDFAFDAFDGDPKGEDQDGDFSALTASLQVARDVAEGVRVTGSVAQGFRAPNLDELARNGSFFGGEELANPDLDPERSLSTELAVDVVQSAWSSSLAVFFTHIEDLIGRRLVEGGTPGDQVFVRDNAGRARIWGAEAAASTRIGPEGSPYRLEGSVAWARGRQYDDTEDPDTGEAPFDGVEFRRIPPLHGRVGFWWEPEEDWNSVEWASLEFVWADDQDQLHPDDVNDSRIDPDGTPGWGVFNVDVGGRFGEESRSSWHVGLINLLDKHYRIHGSGFDGAGRGVVLGLSWRP